jgi:hypothetical protein
MPDSLLTEKQKKQNVNAIELLKQLTKWIKIKDPHVSWNIAMTFNNSFGYRYSHEALKYLKFLSKDENPVVQRAVRSTINHLKKRNKIINFEINRGK